MIKLMGHAPNCARVAAKATEIAPMQVTAMVYAKVPRMAVVAPEQALALRPLAFRQAVAAVWATVLATVQQTSNH